MAGRADQALSHPGPPAPATRAPARVRARFLRAHDDQGVEGGPSRGVWSTPGSKPARRAGAASDLRVWPAADGFPSVLGRGATPSSCSPGDPPPRSPTSSRGAKSRRRAVGSTSGPPLARCRSPSSERSERAHPGTCHTGSSGRTRRKPSTGVESLRERQPPGQVGRVNPRMPAPRICPNRTWGSYFSELGRAGARPGVGRGRRAAQRHPRGTVSRLGGGRSSPVRRSERRTTRRRTSPSRWPPARSTPSPFPRSSTPTTRRRRPQRRPRRGREWP